MKDFTCDSYRLDGKVAIVTGAGGRGNSIGRAYAVALANAGAKVVVADLNAQGAEKVVEEIRQLGGEAIAAQVDIANTESVQAMARTACDAFGGIDILVNNAALMVEIASDGLFNVDRAAFDRAFGVNVWGAFDCAKACAPSMIARGGGAIINQVSGGAFPAQSFYGVTKIALHGMTTTLATHLGSQGIRVNAIAPGMVKTDAGLMLTPDDSPWVLAVEARTPIQGRDTPDALCGALLMLVSDAGRWITGQTINVDGGWVMRN
jgi:NAD(P)-dependent dehydrogenase (short-subunit alcohol dehydrogenase family)